MSAREQQAGDRIDLTRVLANAARELEAMHARADRLDEAVGDLLVTAGGAGAKPDAALLQDMDLLRQSLDCMHVLMRNLAREAAGASMVSRNSLADGVYLEAFRKECLSG